MSLSRIVIFGVTGNQGASVARALLEDTQRKFEVWGVTRNPASRSSQAMEQLGVKLIKGDLDDPSTYEPALKDADGVFLNANFWAHYKGNNSEEAKDAEVRQSSSAVDACKRAGVKHIVYSTLESYAPRQVLPHFDAKAEVTKYMKKLGVPGTQLYTSYYYSNLLSAKLAEQADGTVVIQLPLPDDTVIPAFNAEQIGLFARVAFRNPDKWIGKDLFACGDLLSVTDIARTLSELSGTNYKTQGATKEEFMAHKDKMDGELWLNYLAFVNGEMKRDPAASRKLVPEVQDFKTWASTDSGAQSKFGSKSA